jgi:regulator of replication initiation timing
MTAPEVQRIFEKIDKINENLSRIRTDVDVLKERSTRAVDEASVHKIMKESLAEHARSCAAMVASGGTTIQVKGVNSRLIGTLLAILGAAAAYVLGGSI